MINCERHCTISRTFWRLSAPLSNWVERIYVRKKIIFWKFICLPKSIWSCYATPISNIIGLIFKLMFSSVLVPRGQMIERGECNRICWTSPWFILDLLGDKVFVSGNFWKVLVLLQSKKRRNHVPAVEA